MSTQHSDKQSGSHFSTDSSTNRKKGAFANVLVILALVMALVAAVFFLVKLSYDTHHSPVENQQSQARVSSEAPSTDTSTGSSSHTTVTTAGDVDDQESGAYTDRVQLEDKQASDISQLKVQPEADYHGVEDPWVEGGLFTTGDPELDQMVKGFCDGFSDPNLSAQENAYNTYLHITWYEYVERDNNQSPEGPDWARQYAKQLIWEDGGNCYEFVALTEFCLKYFGYSDVHAEPCLILRQSGNWGNHGLVFVTDFNGRACLCDDALSSNGWMLPVEALTYEIVDVGQYQ